MSLPGSSDHILSPNMITAQPQGILRRLTPRPARFGGVLDSVSVVTRVTTERLSRIGNAVSREGEVNNLIST
jgi:hypothetical protein